MAAKYDPTKPLQPLDLVFSCNVCHDSIRDICSPLQDEKGLDGTQKPVAKLWMTECAHLICAKHLAGGGKRRLPFFWSNSYAVQLLHFIPPGKHHALYVRFVLAGKTTMHSSRCMPSVALPKANTIPTSLTTSSSVHPSLLIQKMVEWMLSGYHVILPDKLDHG